MFVVKAFFNIEVNSAMSNVYPTGVYALLIG